MTIPKVMQNIRFTRVHLGKSEICVVEQFDDGSVAIQGPDVSGIVEECPDALSRAVAHVESKGYVRCE